MKSLASLLNPFCNKSFQDKIWLHCFQKILEMDQSTAWLQLWLSHKQDYPNCIVVARSVTDSFPWCSHIWDLSTQAYIQYCRMLVKNYWMTVFKECMIRFRLLHEKIVTGERGSETRCVRYSTGIKLKKPPHSFISPSSSSSSIPRIYRMLLHLPKCKKTILHVHCLPYIFHKLHCW